MISFCWRMPARTAIAFCCSYRIVMIAGAALSQPRLGYLGTLFGVAWGIVIFGRIHDDLRFWVAILVREVFGVGLVNLGKRRKS